MSAPAGGRAGAPAGMKGAPRRGSAASTPSPGAARRGAAVVRVCALPLSGGPGRQRRPPRPVPSAQCGASRHGPVGVVDVRVRRPRRRPGRLRRGADQHRHQGREVPCSSCAGWCGGPRRRRAGRMRAVRAVHGSGRRCGGRRLGDARRRGARRERTGSPDASDEGSAPGGRRCPGGSAVFCWSMRCCSPDGRGGMISGARARAARGGRAPSSPSPGDARRCSRCS